MKSLLMMALALLIFAPVLARAEAGKPFDFAYTAIDGSRVDLADMRGKVVVVFFWATYSKESRDMVKTIVKVRKQYRDQGLEVVGVSLDSDPKVVSTYTDEYAMNWPEYCDPAGPNAPAVQGLHLKSLPTVWVMNKQGVIAAMNPPDLGAAVAKALAAK